MELAVLLVLSYLLTGVALTGYDFAAHPIDKKGYAASRNYKVAIVIWFVWPVTACLDVYFQYRRKKGGTRLLFSILALPIALFFWLRLFFTIALIIVDIEWLAYVLAAVFGLLSAPIIAGLLMPAHRPNPTMKLPF